MKKLIISLVSVSFVLGASLTAVPAFAADAPSADKPAAPDQQADQTAHKTKSKKGSGGSTTPPPK